MSARTKMVASKIDSLGSIGIGSFWYGANGGVDYQVQIHPESPYPTDLRLAPIILSAYNTLTGMDSTLLNSLNILNARTEAQMGDDIWQAQIDNAESNSMLFLWGSVRDGGCCILKKDDGYLYLYVSYGKVYNQTLDAYTYHMEQINWIENAWDYNSCYFAFQYQFVLLFTILVNSSGSTNRTLVLTNAFVLECRNAVFLSTRCSSFLCS